MRTMVPPPTLLTRTRLLLHEVDELAAATDKGDLATLELIDGTRAAAQRVIRHLEEQTSAGHAGDACSHPRCFPGEI